MIQQEIEERGFAVVPDVLSSDELDVLGTSLCGDEKAAHGRRNVLDLPAVAEFACSKALQEVVEPILAANFFVVRGLFFDKTPNANWKVPWHQDIAVALREKREVAGWSAWSTKAGVPHAHPPTEVLEQMLAVRIHLDDCDAENGALRVVSGSHHGGKISSNAAQWEKAEANSEFVPVSKGGALLMRPLLWHASSPSRSLRPRRVLHLECAARELENLPNGLRWQWKLRA